MTKKEIKLEEEVEDKVEFDFKENHQYSFNYGLEELEKEQYRYPSIKEALHNLKRRELDKIEESDFRFEGVHIEGVSKKKELEGKAYEWIDAAIDRIGDTLIIYEGVKGINLKRIEDRKIYFGLGGPEYRILRAYLAPNFNYKEKHEFHTGEKEGFINWSELSIELRDFLFGSNFVNLPIKTVEKTGAGIYIPENDPTIRYMKFNEYHPVGYVTCDAHQHTYDYGEGEFDRILPLANRGLCIKTPRFAKIHPIPKNKKQKHKKIEYDTTTPLEL